MTLSKVRANVDFFLMGTMTRKAVQSFNA